MLLAVAVFAPQICRTIGVLRAGLSGNYGFIIVAAAVAGAAVIFAFVLILAVAASAVVIGVVAMTAIIDARVVVMVTMRLTAAVLALEAIRTVSVSHAARS